MNSQTNIEKHIGSSADYSADNCWFFYGMNGCLYNSDRYCGIFRSRPVLDYCRYDNELLETYPIPLSELFYISKDCAKGVEALGYKVRFNRILPSDRIYHNLQWFVERSIRTAREVPSYAITHKEKVLATINSYLGFLKWCNAFNLRKEIVSRIIDSPFGLVFEAPEDYSKITIKKDFTKKSYYQKQYRITKKINLNLLSI